jgi:hypothetical protein
MSDWLKNWQDFLDSLATSGGNIVTLFWCSVFSGLLWAWVYTRDPEGMMMTAAFGVFTGFTGALLQAQKGNSSRQQMKDRVEAGIVVPVAHPVIPPPPQDPIPTSTPSSPVK